jgi:hypothetical protein
MSSYHGESVTILIFTASGEESEVKVLALFAFCDFAVADIPPLLKKRKKEYDR